MTKIINKNEEIDIEYFRIDEHLKKICEKYCSLSEKNKREFIEFAKKYTYFNPYFDFAFNRLGYLMDEPLQEKNKILICDDNNYYINQKSSFELKGTSDMKSASDKYIGLNSKSKNSNGCFIDLDGNILQLDLSDRHLKLANTILNQELIKSMKTNQKYKKFNSEYGFYHVIDFLIKELGYIYVKYYNPKTIIFNPLLINKQSNKTLTLIKSYYNITHEEILRKK